MIGDSLGQNFALALLDDFGKFGNNLIPVSFSKGKSGYVSSGEDDLFFDGFIVMGHHRGAVFHLGHSRVYEYGRPNRKLFIDKMLKYSGELVGIWTSKSRDTDLCKLLDSNCQLADQPRRSFGVGDNF